MTLLYLRHGQTDWNAQGRIQSSTDIPLNETGRAQARERAAELLSHQPPVEIIYASPLKRAKETAEIIQSALGVPLYLDERLVERDFGSLEGKKFDRWLDESELAQHGVEPLTALNERVGGFLDELHAAREGKTVLVVAHGCVAFAVHRYYHGQDDSDTTEYGNAALRHYNRQE